MQEEPPMLLFWQSSILLDMNDKIGVFYSDNAPELISAMKILQCRHVLSRDYISKSNAQAERAVRSVLEGTRVNLLQAGLNHWHWPHAARHWCFMQNVIATGGDKSPWELRFGSRFDGPLIPFGCLVDYWNGPKKEEQRRTSIRPNIKPRFIPWLCHSPRIHVEKRIHGCTYKRSH